VNPLLDVKNLSKSYPAGNGAVPVLRNVTFHLEEGRFASLMGPSGCGKSTLLHLLSGTEPPTEGEILLAGKPLAGMDDGALSRLRRTEIGFVFQFFHLLPHFSALENVELPLLLRKEKARPARERARQVLAQVGLEEKGGRRPSQLSGGEQQRVAVARALVHSPRLILADEPTGNLDSASGREVLDLIRGASAQRGCAVLMATHSREASEWGDQVIMMRDGQVNGIYPTRG
jgi:ABC-type lipoprotein export system ATPase subunit